MLRTTPWPPGTPCWADLAVPDVERAKAFYSAVLDWEWTGGDEEHGGYALAGRRGAPAAGVGPQQAPGPVAWTLYLASDDVDATAAAIPAAGGTVVLPPGDVGAFGRMALAADPSGALFGIWQARTHIGASLVNEPGGITWEDLRSTRPDAAWAFYTAVFGIETVAFDMAGPDYRVFRYPGDEAPLGGMGAMMGEPGGSHWLVYFSVEDTDRAVGRVDDSGGSVLRPAVDTSFGRMGAVADPFGARFMVVQNTGQPQPDRSG